MQPPDSTNGSVGHMASANSALSWWPVSICKTRVMKLSPPKTNRQTTWQHLTSMNMWYHKKSNFAAAKCGWQDSFYSLLTIYHIWTRFCSSQDSMTIRLRLNIPNKHLDERLVKLNPTKAQERKQQNNNCITQEITSGLSVCVATILLSCGSSLIRFTCKFNSSMLQNVANTYSDEKKWWLSQHRIEKINLDRI